MPCAVRTDFVTRPPRLSSEDLENMWRNQEGREVPVVDARELIEIKKTNREKDYAVIGDLARLLIGVEEQFLASRSARDILELAARHPDMLAALVDKRPALACALEGADALEAALDAERRSLIHTNERRLERYRQAAAAWADRWPPYRKKFPACRCPTHTV